MAFPTIRSSRASYAASTTIQYPATVNAGDILLWFGAAPITSAQSGWVLLADGGDSANAVVQYKIANGTEGGTTFTASTGYYGSTILAIDSGGALPVASAAPSVAADTPNPPALTPAGGAQDYLWLIWGYALDTHFVAPHTQPSGFTALHSVSGMAVSYQNLNASTLDPAAWGDSDAISNYMFAATAAIAFIPSASNNLFFGSNF